MSGRAKEYGGEMINLAWHSLQSSLAQALPEGLVHWRHGFLGYTETGEGVELELDTPEGTRRVTAQLLVGCDGGQSQVREHMLGDGPPTFLGKLLQRLQLSKEGHCTSSAVAHSAEVHAGRSLQELPFGVPFVPCPMIGSWTLGGSPLALQARPPFW